MRGYDIMKEIEIKTEGAWRPGPGAVYPVLQKLAKQGYITAQKKGSGVQPRLLYEITPAGLENIANAKMMMRSSTERMSLMGRLFIDLMEPDDLVRFVINSSQLQIELVHLIVESDRSGLSKHDRLFILRQYRLNLERELTQAAALIRKIDGRTPSESAAAGGAAPEAKKA
jgi:DNA-binding PadR family transcriptional regulator